MPTRKDVVTLYFCGSGNNRQQGGENTLPLLYEQTKGDRKAIFDGPGGAAILKTEAILKMVEGGKDASTGLAVTKKGKAAAQAKKWQKMITAHHSGGAVNSATGGGTQSNIVMAMQWLWLEYYKEPFVDVNLAGFSRGGVTAIMMSHAIQLSGMADMGNLNVNIFTFDPVPGSLNDFKNKGTFESTGRGGTPKTLAPCTAAYRSLLQETVSKWIGPVPKDRTFKCVQPDYTGSNSKRTPRELIPMPGDHGDSASHANDKGPGAIGAHLCQDFLMAHGTDFSSSYLKSPSELIEAYATARLTYIKGGFFKPQAKQGASKHRVNLVVNPFRQHPFYINHHHASLIAMNYPELVGVIDGDEELDAGPRNKLAKALPTTFSAFVNLNII